MPIPEPQPQSNGFLVTIGDIGVNNHWVVTPNGSAPVAGTTWIVRDMSRVETKIATAGIILAIIFALFCLIGLLFLLMKEEVTTGYIEVSVQGQNLNHLTQVPVAGPMTLPQVQSQVGQARALAAQAA